MFGPDGMCPGQDIKWPKRLDNHEQMCLGASIVNIGPPAPFASKGGGGQDPNLPAIFLNNPCSEPFQGYRPIVFFGARSDQSKVFLYIPNLSHSN